jgi:phospholipid transport system transporter-binding protein
VSEVALPPRVTLTEASAAARDLAAKAAASPNGAAASAASALVIDAGAVQAFDSSAFAVMLEVARKARADGHGGVTVRGAPASMVALAKLYGVDELLKFEG